MLARYLKLIQVQRQDFNGRVITVRGDDTRSIAAMLDVPVDQVAERLADVVMLTDDNPRSENGDDIIAEIRGGMQGEPLVERDREAAIRLAIGQADVLDLVLVAGKGHEYYEINGDEVRHFSDRETVEAVLEELRA